MSEPRVSLWTLTAYGAGRIPEAVKVRFFDTFVFFYYVQILEVKPDLVGVAIAVALVFDAFTDPMMGSFSDRFDSRWGRRHPFMLSSLVPLPVFFVLLIVPPAGLGSMALAIWLCAFLVLTRSAVTLFQVPYLSLAPELVTDFDRRSTLVVIRGVFAIVGTAVVLNLGFGYFLAPTEQFRIGQLNQAGYLPFGVALAVIMVASGLITIIGTRKHVPYLVRPQRLRRFRMRDIYRDLYSALRSPSFRIVFFSYFLFVVYLGAHAVTSLHMSTYFWNLTTREIQIYTNIVIVGALLGTVLAGPVMRMFDKKSAYLSSVTMALLFAASPVILRLLDLFPGRENALFFPTLVGMHFVGLVAGLVAGTASASMILDTTDEHELMTGQRQEGAFFGAVSFSAKFSSGIGHAMAGYILTWIQFPLGANVRPEEIAPEVIRNLGIFYGPGIAVLPIIAVLMVFRYRITRHRHVEIMRELEVKRRECETEHAATADGSVPGG